MPHHYRVDIWQRESPADASKTPVLSFETTNHDDLAAILAKVRASAAVPEAEAAEFVVGLKLFAEVMLRHRKEPLFEALMPHMGAFMKRLKASAATAAAD